MVRRPPTPPPPEASKHRVGRLQRGCWRALVAARGRELLTRDLLAWCFPGADLYRAAQRWNVRRAARRFAIRVGRDRREATWRLRDEQ